MKITTRQKLLGLFCLMSFIGGTIVVPVVSTTIDSRTTPDQPSDIVLPRVTVESIDVITEIPEEGEPINILVNIHNNGSRHLSELTLSLSVADASDFQGGPLSSEEEEGVPFAKNSTFSIEANGKTSLDYQFQVESGNYQITAIILFNNTIIPDSSNDITMSVIGPPIGDVNVMIGSVIGVLVSLFAVMLIPAIVDLFRKSNSQ